MDHFSLLEADDADAAAEQLRGAGALFLRVRGASMAPALWPGDVLRVRPVRFENVIVGDIVAYALAGRLVTHRVTARGASLLTRGDAATRVDAAVQREQLLGRVDLVLRRAAAFTPPRRPAALHRLGAQALRRVPLLSKIAQRMRATL